MSELTIIDTEIKLAESFSSENLMSMVNNFTETTNTKSQVEPPNTDTINSNGKRALVSDDEDMPDESDTQNADPNQNLKPNLIKEEKQRLKLEKFKKLKASKVKTAKQVIYKDQVPASQALNEAHPGLGYQFEYDTSTKRFICRVEIKVGTPGLVDQVNRFVGEGLSKKEAKKACAHRALIAMYPFSYKPPQHVLDSFNERKADITRVKEEQSESLLDKEMPESEKIALSVHKRLVKLCSKPCVAFKTATQLLYESCKQVADTAVCVQENGPIEEQRFAYKITNVLDPEAGSNEAKCVAYGFGKKKQEAKNAACKQALKQFFNFDIDQILASAAAFAAVQSMVTSSGGMNAVPGFSVNEVAGGPVGVPPPPIS
jgi:dsRNA-specific ribonuclease